jgi:hypothetical protein
VRFGIGPFNTADDIRTAVKAVSEIASKRIGRRKVSIPIPNEERAVGSTSTM